MDSRINTRISVGAVVLFALLSWSGPAPAQSDASVPEAELRQPWVLQLSVVESLTGTLAAVDAGRRPELDATLRSLEEAIGAYETQLDRVIDRIVGDPQFAYVATEVSEALAAKLVEIHGRFDSLYGACGVRDREDVRTAQAALDRLRGILAARKPFETDVLSALGSGSRTKIVELATRWWNGEERAIAVKKAVAALRQQLNSASP